MKVQQTNNQTNFKGKLISTRRFDAFVQRAIKEHRDVEKADEFTKVLENTINVVRKKVEEELPKNETVKLSLPDKSSFLASYTSPHMRISWKQAKESKKMGKIHTDRKSEIQVGSDKSIYQQNIIEFFNEIPTFVDNKINLYNQLKTSHNAEVKKQLELNFLAEKAQDILKPKK